MMSMNRSKSFRTLAFACLALGFVACTTELKHGLTENQADEILVELRERNIKATKKAVEVNRELRFTVMTNRSRLEEAQQILVALGLPREKVIGIEQICGGNDALIPSPTIDRCKRQLALQNEIARGLMLFDGIVDVKVNVNLPEPTLLSEQSTARPTAAVVLKYIADESGKEPFEEKKIREYVANSVDNLDYNDVTVLATSARTIRIAKNPFVAKDDKKDKKKDEGDKKDAQDKNGESGDRGDVQVASAPSSSLMGIEVSPQSAKKLKIALLFGCVVFMLLGGGLVVTVLHAQQLKASNERLARRPRLAKSQPQRRALPAESAPGQQVIPLNRSNVMAPTEFDNPEVPQEFPPEGVNYNG